jgi:hypothetical protein
MCAAVELAIVEFSRGEFMEPATQLDSLAPGWKEGRLIELQRFELFRLLAIAKNKETHGSTDPCLRACQSSSRESVTM